MDIILDKNSSDAIYVQLSNQLKNYIAKKNLEPGAMLPDIKTIARSAKVSVKTAERALDKLIKEGICFRRPKKGTFVADGNTASNQTDKYAVPSCIAFILSGTDFANSYHARVLKGVEEIASAKGFHLICASVPYKDKSELTSKINSIASRRDLRAVLVGGKLDNENVALIVKLLGENIPTIIMGRTIHGFYDGIIHITDSNGLAIRTSLQFLKDSGHRNIAFLNEPLCWAWNREIRDEFYNFMRTNNLPLYPKAIMDDLPGETADDGYEATARILPHIKKRSITAIACGTDKLARGAMKALKENGLNVPEDISVIGCGNLDFCEYLEPPLTSVDQCEEEKGREGARAALGNYKPGTIVRIPIRLIERKSTKKNQHEDFSL